MHVSIHGRRVARMVYIYYRSLFSKNLLVVGMRCGWYPHLSPAKTSRVSLCPLFLFFKGVSQHLGWLILLASQACPIWIFTWGIRSWGSFWVSMYLTSLEGVPKWSENLWGYFLSLEISARSDEFFFPTDHLGGLWSCFWADILLHYCLAFFFPLHYCLAGFFGLLLVPKGFLVSRGSGILGGTAPQLQAMSWEVFSLTSCLIFQIWIRTLWIYSLISYGITLVVVSLLHSFE